MLTTRMSPKISVNPLATTKYSAAAVSPLSSVIRKSFGSSTAGPKLVPDAMNSTQMTGSDEEREQDRSDQRGAATRMSANPPRGATVTARRATVQQNYR